MNKYNFLSKEIKFIQEKDSNNSKFREIKNISLITIIQKHKPNNLHKKKIYNLILIGRMN